MVPKADTQKEKTVPSALPKIIEPEKEVLDEIIEQVVEKENLNALSSSLGTIPNVFTPNGDGINDHFIFPVENIAELKMNIYNAKGVLVFQIARSEKVYWDGNLRNGQAAETGNYYYAIFATGFDKQKHQRKGSLYLNR